jgi:peptide/nickel transport system ATP-binding protein
MSMHDKDDQGGAPVLAVEQLRTEFITRAGTVRAVDDVSFTLRAGEILGLVGESGSGKSMTGYSIMGLVDPPGRVSGGSIRLNGRELRGLPEREMRKLRGERIAMIFQDPMMTLNPVLRIDTQMTEAVLAHHLVGRQRAREMARDALARVGLSAPEEKLRAYPHQFSGGMRQRVAIAIALLNRPDLIICDEPTTALDVTTQNQILYEMQSLCRESGSALIWISHDLAVVAGLADRVAVMYAGQLVESGPVAQVLDHPHHPYTRGLIASSPARNRRGAALAQIAGSTPAPLDWPSGCRFRDRCPRATEICATPPGVDSADGHRWRCFHPVFDEEQT